MNASTDDAVQHVRVPDHDHADTDDLDAGWVGAVGKAGEGDVSALMNVGSHSVRFQLDSGATVNLLPQRYADAYQPTSRTLKMWDGSTYTPVGETRVSLMNPKTGSVHSVHFFVCKDAYRPLLGVDAVQELGLIQIQRDNFVSSVTSVETQFPSVFDGSLGKLPGSVKLRVRDATPTVLPARKLPLAMQDKVKAELDRLCAMGVLRPVTEPTDWTSQMAIATKGDGSLRVCIDPQSLNKVLCRERYQLPTFEDVLPKFTGAKVFSKLDVSSAFWHLELTEKSSLLTTMATPFGRYCWTRLPFGLCVSSEIFQRHLHDALEGLTGVVCVADDIVVFGNAEADHDANLHALLQRCVEKGISLNHKKCAFYCPQISFLGHIITADGVSADPAKVRAILGMPEPQTVHDIRRFCGMVQYLAKYLPSLSEVAKPLRDLTRKDAPWVWGAAEACAFKQIKQMVSDTPVLAHFRADLPLVLQTDASQNALGAALLQDGRPIAYASRSLTDCEKRYAQIEKECLSVVFGLQRFDQYTYGRDVTVENDHKPLQSILSKPLSCAPKRLQAMMMALHRYSIHVIYRPGSAMVLADTLSRAPAPSLHFTRSSDHAFSCSSDNVFSHARLFADNSFSTNPFSCAFAHPSGDSSLPFSDANVSTRTPTTAGDISSSERYFERVNALKHMPISDMRLQEIRDATSADHTLRDLLHVIRQGWPDKHDLPTHLFPFYDVRDTFSVADGIILKGERILIPQSMRSVILKRLHASHLGADSMLRRAREVVFWPGLTGDVRQMAFSCDVCAAFQPHQHKEPLIQHERGDSPWVKVGVDLFECDGRTYLVTVDYYSGWFEFDLLSSSVSLSVINKLKSHFARYGIPQMIMSDNGRQFVSSEFDIFCKEWGIEHRTSSPYHSRSNGMAESAVKAAKRLLMKTGRDGSDVCGALLELRNTPRQGVGVSPAQLMFGRRTRSNVPCSNLHMPTDSALPRPSQRSNTVARHYDRGARELPGLHEGQPVWVAPSPATGPTWTEAVVTTAHGPRSYTVDGSGGEWRRNRIHLRPASNGARDSRVADAAPGRTPSGESDSTPRAPPTLVTRETPSGVAHDDDELMLPRRSMRTRRTPERYGFANQ